MSYFFVRLLSTFFNPLKISCLFHWVISFFFSLCVWMCQLSLFSVICVISFCLLQVYFALFLTSITLGLDNWFEAFLFAYIFICSINFPSQYYCSYTTQILMLYFHFHPIHCIFYFTWDSSFIHMDYIDRYILFSLQVLADIPVVLLLIPVWCHCD